MKTLANNGELYQYLLSLATMLRDRKAKELSEAVMHASMTSAGMRTEFLGESRIALREVSKKAKKILTPRERAGLSDVLRQLDDVFEKRVKTRVFL